jgi:exosome complex component RRP41
MGLCQMDSKLSTDLFEKVLTLAMEGSKAIAEYMRQMLLENTQKLAFARGTLKR